MSKIKQLKKIKKKHKKYKPRVLKQKVEKTPLFSNTCREKLNKIIKLENEKFRAGGELDVEAIRVKLQSTGASTKYRIDMCQQAVSLLKTGASMVEVEVLLEVSTETLARWRRTHIEFDAAIELGQKMSKAWWLAQGRKHLENKGFNSALYYMNMKNRHGWSDGYKVEQTGKQEVVVRFERPAVAPAEQNQVTGGSSLYIERDTQSEKTIDDDIIDIPLINNINKGHVSD